MNIELITLFSMRHTVKIDRSRVTRYLFDISSNTKYSDRCDAQSIFFLIYFIENGMSLLSKGLHSNVSEFLQFTETGKMVKLIEEFKKEHSLIVDTLSKSRKIGVDSRKGQDKILSAKDFILAHLKKEDEKLYPLLRKAAKSSQIHPKAPSIFGWTLQLF